MTEQEIIREICEKENRTNLYDINISGLPAYSIIRGFIRYKIIENYGLPNVKLRSPLNRLNVLKSALSSFWQLLVLFCSKKKFSTIYYAFARVDKIGGSYLDKCTDPIIEQCKTDDRYLILDYGRAGVHYKPRVHSDSIVYLDFISVLSRLYGLFFCKYFYNKYKSEFDLLFKELNALYELDFKKSEIIKELAFNSVYVGMLQRIFQKISAERVIGPARAFMMAPFIAAKRQGMKTFELQHGITYGETVLYSGYRDKMITPDFFLAFGNNKPLDVYGIEENKIINIGWALNDYIADLPNKNMSYGNNDVLVVSDPEVTRPMLNAVIILAKENPGITFYFRPHPHEEFNRELEEMLNPYPNVKIQDKSINITIVLNMFNLVVGENSTVMYEALSLRKKVGRLYYEGLRPLYTDESDRDCFWEIRNQKDFIEFVEGDVNSKRNKCIYSSFDKKKYLSITGISK